MRYFTNISFACFYKSVIHSDNTPLTSCSFKFAHIFLVSISPIADNTKVNIIIGITKFILICLLKILFVGLWERNRKDMNYKIITDEQELIDFINWLPELEDHETFYCCLFARSKYVKDTHGLTHIRSDKAQLKRFTSNKERLLTKIKQLECRIDAYKQKDVIVPQQALALYITINPRSFIKANTASVRKLLDLALQPYNGFHPYQEVMSEIQKSKSRSEFVSFDFDCSEEVFSNALGAIKGVLNSSSYNIVQTRGGFHVIVNPKKVCEIQKKKWYQVMRQILSTYSDDHDNAGDIMLPIPGTYQGGFTPKFIK